MLELNQDTVRGLAFCRKIGACYSEFLKNKYVQATSLIDSLVGPLPDEGRSKILKLNKLLGEVEKRSIKLAYSSEKLKKTDKKLFHAIAEFCHFQYVKFLAEISERIDFDDLRYTTTSSQLKRQYKMMPNISLPWKGRWALQEVYRINIGRFLKYMDETQKAFSYLNSKGNIVRTSAAKIYPMFVCAEVSGPRLSKASYHVYLNKEGIERVESV